MAEVAKFGGTSMAQIDTVLRIVEEESPAVLVVSAPGKDVSLDGFHSSELGAHKMTDMLLQGDVDRAEARALEIIERSGLGAREGAGIIESMRGWLQQNADDQAACAATGERFSAELIARLTGRILLDPRALVSINRDRTPDANVTVHNLRSAIDTKKHYVLPGFYGYDNGGGLGGVQILDRGGSDTSGALAAAALGLPYFNFTDVNGFYTTDPRLNVFARQIPNLTYEQARALALGGSKLLHPEVARIMRGSNLATTVRNTFNVSAAGTKITNISERQQGDIVGVASRQVRALDIRRTGMDESAGVMSGVYEALAESGIPYLLTNDGSDETAIFFDAESVDGPNELREIAESAIRDAEISVTEFGLVVAVFSKTRPYAYSFMETVAAATAVDTSVIPSSSISRQSVELFTKPQLVGDVEAGVHELILH